MQMVNYEVKETIIAVRQLGPYDRPFEWHCGRILRRLEPKGLSWPIWLVEFPDGALTVVTEGRMRKT